MAIGAASEVLRVFLRLGLTSFGGPIAHLGDFREELVVRRRRIDEAAFAHLVALCQFLAGLLVLSAALLLPAAALAGPPYLTDDPVPVEPRHWELYLASQSAFSAAGFAGTAPHLEVNYGAVEGVQLHLVAPLVLAAGGGATPCYGPGDLELGAKVRFVEEERAGVEVGIFPILTLPTGSSARGLGEGAATLLLPIWLQKGFGPWTTYGGGGYWLRAGADHAAHWLLGWQLQRQLGPVALGAELYRETRSAGTLAGATGFSLGAIVDLSETHHLLASVGAGQGLDAGHAYLGWLVTLGPPGDAPPGLAPAR